MHKWMRAGVLTAALGSCFVAGVYAKDTLQKVEAYLRPDFTVELDGHRVITDTPLIYNGNSYLPFRQMSNMLGAEVDWDEATKTIRLTRPPAPSGVPGSGTGGTTGGSNGSTTTPNPTPNPTPAEPVKVEEEIALRQLVRYNFKYKNVDYPVLANTYKNVMYVRWSDVQQMPFSLGIQPLSKDKQTGEMYVDLSLLRPIFGDQVRGDIREYPIVESGTIETSKLKAINEYFGVWETGYSIKPLAEENRYSVLAQGSNLTLKRYTLQLKPKYDGGWSVSSIEWSTYPSYND